MRQFCISNVANLCAAADARTLGPPLQELAYSALLLLCGLLDLALLLLPSRFSAYEYDSNAGLCVPVSAKRLVCRRSSVTVCLGTRRMTGRLTGPASRRHYALFIQHAPPAARHAMGTFEQNHNVDRFLLSAAAFACGSARLRCAAATIRT